MNEPPAERARQWWRIEAPHFTAGLIFQNGVAVDGAPILKWAKGKQLKWMQSYCQSKGWRMEALPDRKPKLNQEE